MTSKELSKKIKLKAWNMAYKAKSSHMGGNFSEADLLAVLYNDILIYDPKNPDDENRGDCEIIRRRHNRNKGSKSMKGRFCPKFIFSYPKVNGKRGDGGEQEEWRDVFLCILPNDRKGDWTVLRYEE